MNAILSICIPTYNREANLSLLLNSIAVEIKELQDQVSVIIGDNASNDNTRDTVNKFVDLFPTTCTIFHERNVGADENFAICIEQVKTPYFWMIGDDDLPKVGVLSKIIDIISSEEVDLLYLKSKWMSKITRPDYCTPLPLDLSVNKLTKLEFAKKVNVWVTFISGMVVNLKRLREIQSDTNLRKYNGSGFVQLGWVLPLLMCGQNFIIVNNRVLLATKGGTRDYKLFQVFGQNLPRILKDACGENSIVYKYISRVLEWQYLPGLILATRFNKVGNLHSENIINSLVELKKSNAYWFIISMIKLPKSISFLLYMPIKIIVSFIFLLI